MKTLTYEEMKKIDPLTAQKAELHEFCEWLEAMVGQSDDIKDYTAKTHYENVIAKLKHHDLWVN